MQAFVCNCPLKGQVKYICETCKNARNLCQVCSLYHYPGHSIQSCEDEQYIASKLIFEQSHQRKQEIIIILFIITFSIFLSAIYYFWLYHIEICICYRNRFLTKLSPLLCIFIVFIVVNIGFIYYRRQQSKFKKLKRQHQQIQKRQKRTKLINEQIKKQNYSLEGIFNAVKYEKAYLSPQTVFGLVIIQTELLYLRNRVNKQELKRQILAQVNKKSILICDQIQDCHMIGRVRSNKHFNVFDLTQKSMQIQIESQKIQQMCYKHIHLSKNLKKESRIKYLLENLTKKFKSYNLNIFISESDKFDFAVGCCKGSFLFRKLQFGLNILIVLA